MRVSSACSRQQSACFHVHGGACQPIPHALPHGSLHSGRPRLQQAQGQLLQQRQPQQQLWRLAVAATTAAAAAVAHSAEHARQLTQQQLQDQETQHLQEHQQQQQPAAHTAGEPAGQQHQALDCEAAAAAAAAAAAELPPDKQQQQQQDADQQQQDADQTRPKKQHQAPLLYFRMHEPPLDAPVPVQLPPPGTDNAPPRQRPFLSPSYYRPPRFLTHFPAISSSSRPDGATQRLFNAISFLGKLDPHDGKYFVPPHRLDDFLRPVFNSMAQGGRRLFLAESYAGQPYKLFQELDFPWELDVSLVLALLPAVIDIFAQEAAAACSLRAPPQPLVSMRTPYKVHLNLPGVWVVEATARRIRKAVINRCRAELSGQAPLGLLREEEALAEQVDAGQAALARLRGLVAQLEGAGQAVGGRPQQLLEELAAQQAAEQQRQQQVQQQERQQQRQQQLSAILPGASGLDWQSIVDFPHGSLRLLGCCKAPWMDSDPAWVEEKCYSHVECVGGTWMRQPLTYEALAASSILLSESEMRVYETSDDFLEASYQAADHREQQLAARRLMRSTSKEIKRLTQLLAALQAGKVPPADSSAVEEQQQVSARQRRALLYEQAKAQRQQQQEAQQEEQREEQRKRQEALAKLQAAAASMSHKVQQQQQPGGAGGLQRPGSSLQRPKLQRPGGSRPDAEDGSSAAGL